MPYNTPAPDFALLAAFDARPWSAVDVVSYNGVNITMPTFSAGEGVYEDGVYFLNGRGVGDNTPSRAMGTFTDALSTLATFNLSWSVTLTADDRVKVTSDDVFTVAPLDDDVLGLVSQTAVADGLNFSVTGSAEWTRGNYRGERYQFGDTFGTTFDAFRELANRPWPAQDIVAGMRERGSADLDDLSPTNCLEVLMRDLKIAVNEVETVGTEPLARMFSVVQWGDFVSYYLAMLNGVDPTPIAVIDHLKKELAER